MDQNNEKDFQEVLQDPAVGEEIGADEAAVRAAGLTHPNDVELENILAEDWESVPDLPEAEAFLEETAGAAEEPAADEEVQEEAAPEEAVPVQEAEQAPAEEPEAPSMCDEPTQVIPVVTDTLAQEDLQAEQIAEAEDEESQQVEGEYVTVQVRKGRPKMKKGAVLLNLARGELVKNEDILAALESGQLRKYVTDFPNAEIIDKPGVIAIPHLGASTPESEDNCVDMVSHQIDEYLKYGSIRNSVNYPNCELGPNFRQRVAVMHANVPNTIGTITSIVASAGINIDNMTNKSRGAFAYTVLDLDHSITAEALAGLKAMDMVYRVRVFDQSPHAVNLPEEMPIAES